VSGIRRSIASVMLEHVQEKENDKGSTGDASLTVLA